MIEIDNKIKRKSLKPFSLGILKCDSVLSELSESFPDYDEMIRSMLFDIASMSSEKEAAENTRFNQFSCTSYDVVKEEYPKNIQAMDGYIISGSRHSVNEELAWIGKLKTFVGQLLKAEIPLIGICFGHQLIADVLGTPVTKSDKGWGVGVHSWQFLKKAEEQLGLKSLKKIERDSFSLVVSHQDQVTALPKGAELLAESSFCPIAMFSYGTKVLAMQGHPEFSKAYSMALLSLRLEQGILREGLRASAEKSYALTTDENFIGLAMAAFLRRAKNKP